jgi:hypothetical protein
MVRIIFWSIVLFVIYKIYRLVSSAKRIIKQQQAQFRNMTGKHEVEDVDYKEVK